MKQLSLLVISIVLVLKGTLFPHDLNSSYTNQRWLITFIFGLMHGFGFANVLTESGLPARGLIVSLLSFNIGVEIGQIIILAVIFPIVVYFLKTNWERKFVYTVSSIILIFGMIWFIERAFNVSMSLI